MNILPAQAIKPAEDAQVIESFSVGNGSTGFMDDMMANAFSELSAHVAQLDNRMSKALKADLGDPLSALALEKVSAEKSLTFNLVTGIVSKIPKTLEILNK